MLGETWKQFTEQQIIDFCNKRGSRTFTLEEFNDDKKDLIVAFSSKNNHPFDKIRQQLQFLRNDGIITFEDNKGTYTLRRPAILKGELSDDEPLESDDCLSEAASKFDYENKLKPRKNNSQLEKREYTHETFARNRGWVKQAKETFGYHCLHPDCKNSFLKPDGKPYIEVHHIIPLFQYGEDGIWNLTVLCAHHHRMAHFAENIVKENLQKLFLGIINERLQQNSHP